MEFFASAEVDQSAFEGLDRARRCVTPYLKAAIAASSLATLQCKLRYVPIAMPDDAQARYPARSKFRKKEQLYDCAPVLAYDVFVSGSLEEQLEEYIRGIALSTPYLPKLGATPQQVEDFERILAQAVEVIMLERPDQTRH